MPRHKRLPSVAELQAQILAVKLRMEQVKLRKLERATPEHILPTITPLPGDTPKHQRLDEPPDAAIERRKQALEDYTAQNPQFAADRAQAAWILAEGEAKKAKAAWDAIQARLNPPTQAEPEPEPDPEPTPEPEGPPAKSWAEGHPEQAKVLHDAIAQGNEVAAKSLAVREAKWIEIYGEALKASSARRSAARAETFKRPVPLSASASGSGPATPSAPFLGPPFVDPNFATKKAPPPGRERSLMWSV